MATIWIIESGEYSDYNVDGIFSTKENAEAVVAKLKATGSCADYRINERDLDPGIDALRQGYKRFTVWMLLDGTTEKVREDAEWGFNGRPWVWRRSTTAAYRGQNLPDCLVAEVFARDERHAIKIVNEQRAKAIAEGQRQ